MELLPIALISAAAVVVAYYIGKWVGKGNAFVCILEPINATKSYFVNH